jgi:hypothetical protein
MKVSDLKAAEKIKIGQIGDKPVIWLVGEHNHYQEDATVLVSEGTLGNITFAPANPVDHDRDRRLWGSNRYKDSYVRKCLNHDAFLKAIFSPIERAAIVPTEIESSIPYIDDPKRGKKLDVVKDVLFLLSASELGFVDGGDDEGCIIELFRNPGFRSALDIDGDRDWYWLRTPYASHSYSVRGVNTNGTLTYNYADNGHIGLRPACNLKSFNLVSGPDDEGCYSLVFDKKETKGGKKK